MQATAANADLRHLSAISKRLRQLKDQNGLLCYEPHAKQDLFHRAGAYKRRYARTGNRFGKSEMGAAEDLSFARGERVWYAKDDPARTVGIPQHPNKILIVCQTWDKVDQVFTSQEGGENQGKLWKFLPKSWIVDSSTGNGGHINKVVVRSKYGSGDNSYSIIRFDTVKTYQNNKLNSESSDYDLVHIDEPIPKKMWEAIARGLVDRAGSAIFTCTPLDQMWINRYFIPPTLIRETLTQPLYNDSDSKFVITGSMDDNPYNSELAKKMFLGDVGGDEQVLQCRRFGIPMALTGLVYKAFDRNKHVFYDVPSGWKDKTTPPKDWTIKVYIDCHPKTPQAVSLFAISPHNHIRQYDEIFQVLSIPELCEVIKDRTKGLDVSHLGADPYAWNPHPNDGSCMADDFYDCGLYVEPTTKELRRGILAVQHLLNKTDERGFAQFQVSSDCDEFLYEIDDYCWDQEKEKPVDMDDHMMENLYRATVEGLEYQSPSGNITPSDLKLRPVTFDTSLPNLSTDLSLLAPSRDVESISWT